MACISVTTSSPLKPDRSMPPRTTASSGPGGISANPSGSGTALGSVRSSIQLGASPTNVIIISAPRAVHNGEEPSVYHNAPTNRTLVR